MIVLFRNLTTVIRMQEKLAKNGIVSSVVQTTKNPGKPACGHALKLDDRLRSDLERAANDLGVKIMGVYYE